MQGIADRAAEPAGMQIFRGCFQGDFASCIATRPDIDTGKIGPPACAIGRQHRVGGKRVRMFLQQGAQRRAAGFLFALQQDLHVDRQPPLDGQKCRKRFKRNGRGSLVVRNAAPVQPPVADLRIERGGMPFVDRIRRLHVIMAVDDESRSRRRFQPFRVDRGMAARLEFADIGKARFIQPTYKKRARIGHAVQIKAVGTDRLTPDQLLQPIYDILTITI